MLSFASKTGSVGEQGHVGPRLTPFLLAKGDRARDALFVDRRRFPPDGLTSREVHPELLGATGEYPSREQLRPQSPGLALPDRRVYVREVSEVGRSVSLEDVQDDERGGDEVYTEIRPSPAVVGRGA